MGSQQQLPRVVAVVEGVGVVATWRWVDLPAEVADYCFAAVAVLDFEMAGAAEVGVHALGSESVDLVEDLARSLGKTGLVMVRELAVLEPAGRAVQMDSAMAPSCRIGSVEDEMKPEMTSGGRAVSSWEGSTGLGTAAAGMGADTTPAVRTESLDVRSLSYTAAAVAAGTAPSSIAGLAAAARYNTGVMFVESMRDG